VGQPTQLGFPLQLLPKVEPVRFSDSAELNVLLAQGPLGFDALLMPAEEGTA
jgi:hypothetical protein